MKSTALFSVIGCIATLVMSSVGASAHCRNEREVCHKIIDVCYHDSAAWFTEFRRVQGSSQIGATVASCGAAAWNGGKNFANDDAVGCEEGEWFSISKAVLQGIDDHIQGACNQLQP